MLQCIDDVMNGEGATVFELSDGSRVSALQDTSRTQSPFILVEPECVSNEQIDAVQKWAACPVMKVK